MKKSLSAKPWIALLLAVALAAPLAAFARPAQQQDFLTQNEADQIRNADSADARIGLFLDFAADRLQRFEHELQIKSTGPLRADFLNDLLDSFSACVDEASSRVDDAVNNGVDVRKGIRDIRKRVPRFLAELKKIKAKGTELKIYQDSLDDAAADLHDDLRDAKKAEKKLQFNSPAPKPGPESD
ncbi:MAG TPA: hypothetical protein VNJ52_06810 [Patescibacteria group bacterium]|nr:hypothetical protein [Patescibacteria group bacterium]